MTELTDKQIKWIDERINGTCGMGHHIFLNFFKSPIELTQAEKDYNRYIHKMIFAEKMNERFPHWCFSDICDESIGYYHALDQYLKKDLQKYYDFNTHREFTNTIHDKVNIIGMFHEAKHKREKVKTFKRWWKDSRVQWYCCGCFKVLEIYKKECVI